MTLTKEWQQALTPQEIVDLMKAGNQRFLRDERQDRDYLHDRAATAAGQHPAAVILSCIDSRAPAEIILERGIGDTFNARIAGNFVDDDLRAAWSLPAQRCRRQGRAGDGPYRCGAIKGAIDGAKLGNLTALLEKLGPAVRAVKDVAGPRTTKNAAFVDAVAAENVRLTLLDIRRISPVLAGLEREKKILMVGAMYHVESGEMQFLD